MALSTRSPGDLAARLLVPAGAALSLLPQVPGAAALLGGAAVALLLGNPWAASTRRAQKLLLPAAVVGLGAAMDLGVVLRTGLQGFGYTLASITLTMGAGLALARALRVGGSTGTLIAVGTAICGGSAIAAAAPVVRADDHETGVALATVFVLNGVALVVFPPVGRLAALSPHAFGTWAALAIHDTSSVVGAGMAYGPEALATATAVKLARALWIVPLVLALAWWRRSEDGASRQRAPRPWFILGFVAMAALVTWVPALRGAGHRVAAGAHRALVLTLYLIGAGLSREALRKVGIRPLALGSVLWVAVSVTSLAAIRLSAPGAAPATAASHAAGPTLAGPPPPPSAR